MNFDNYIAEEFDDIRILRYRVDVFETLPLQEKLFVYYLSRAALAGRDILWDQNNRYNLRIRKVLERIICKYEGDRSVAEFQAFLLYAKKVFLPTVFIIIIPWINLFRHFRNPISACCWSRPDRELCSRN